MGEKSINDLQPVSFGARLANSQVFADLFRDGMALVEETATYLDGPGRQESKKLERARRARLRHRKHAADHAADAARLLAAAASRGEGRRDVARPGQQGKEPRSSCRPPTIHEPHNLELLPAALRELIERSHKLQGKVRRLDATIHNHDAPEQAAAGNPVERQLGLLKAAFGAESV